jgi:hypothetical protein
MIFLDFEGFTNKKPSFVGYQIDGSFKQIVLDVDFMSISKETDIEFKEYEEFCDWILSKSYELKQHNKIDVDGMIYIVDKLDISLK